MNEGNISVDGGIGAIIKANNAAIKPNNTNNSCGKASFAAFEPNVSIFDANAPNPANLISNRVVIEETNCIPSITYWLSDVGFNGAISNSIFTRC